MRNQSWLILLLGMTAVVPAQAGIHVWEKQELTLQATRSFGNPYMDVTVWVDLRGPHFHKRVYGFWDGGQTFRVRLLATERGTWTWKSGSTSADPGLSGKTGSFVATSWSEEEKQQNPLRRGFLRATSNHHALEFPDGTPFLALGDTWWAVGTNRFRWYDDDRQRPLGPTAGFKDYVRYRKSQGYNWINLIAAFPNWMTDAFPWRVVMNDPEKTVLRSAWLQFGTGESRGGVRLDGAGGPQTDMMPAGNRVERFLKHHRRLRSAIEHRGHWRGGVVAHSGKGAREARERELVERIGRQPAGRRESVAQFVAISHESDIDDVALILAVRFQNLGRHLVQPRSNRIVDFAFWIGCRPWTIRQGQGPALARMRPAVSFPASSRVPYRLRAACCLASLAAYHPR